MDTIEQLAALEHEQWAHWTKYLLETVTPRLVEFSGMNTLDELESLCEGVIRIGLAFPEKMATDVDVRIAVEKMTRMLDCAQAIKRWQRQIATPYAALTEAEKESDREWARRVLEIVEEK